VRISPDQISTKGQLWQNV